MTDHIRDDGQFQHPAAQQPASDIELAALPARRPSQATGDQEADLRSSSEQREHQPCLEDSSHDDSEDVQLPRRHLANLEPSSFSLVVSLLLVYFLVFAALAVQAEASPVLAGSRALWLLEAAKYLFSGFMSSAATFSNGYIAMERFFLNPDAPFQLVASDFDDETGPQVYEVTPIADVGAALSSRRFTRLLSTFWMASYAPLAIMTGSTSSDDKVYNLTQESHGALFVGSSGSNVASADVITTEVVLRVNKAWAAGLIIISAILILAEISVSLLDVWQKSPSVIDFFVSNLRHNPYAEIGEYQSTEDGADMARRLKHTIVQIGDARSDGDIGMIAIATPTESRPVQEIRRRRNYT